MKTYIFKTKLLNDKKVIREIETLDGANLYKLAETIVGAVDFGFGPPFRFFRKFVVQKTRRDKLQDRIAQELKPLVVPAHFTTVFVEIGTVCERLHQEAIIFEHQIEFGCKFV